MCKKKKVKVYGIFHDNNYILCGTGSKGKDDSVGRKGFHLPGGTVEKNSDEIGTLKDELLQETGINPEKLNFEGVEPIHIADIKKPCVKVIEIKVKSVQALIEKADEKKRSDKAEDPGFKKLKALPKKECWKNENFCSDYETDWFATALSAVFKN